MRSHGNDQELLRDKLAHLEEQIVPLARTYGHLVEDTAKAMSDLIVKLECIDEKLYAKQNELVQLNQKLEKLRSSGESGNGGQEAAKFDMENKSLNNDVALLELESKALNQEIDSYNEAEHQRYLHLKHEIHLCQSQIKKGSAASAKAFEVQATASRHIVTTVNLLTGIIQAPSALQTIQDQYGYKIKKFPDSEDAEIIFTSKDKPDIRLTKGAIYGDIKTAEDAKLIGEAMANIFLQGIAGRILHHVVIEKSDPSTSDAAIQELERIYAKLFQENGFDNIQINGKTPGEHLNPATFSEQGKHATDDTMDVNQNSTEPRSTSPGV